MKVIDKLRGSKDITDFIDTLREYKVIQKDYKTEECEMLLKQFGEFLNSEAIYEFDTAREFAVIEKAVKQLEALKSNTGVNGKADDIFTRAVFQAFHPELDKQNISLMDNKYNDLFEEVNKMIKPKTKKQENVMLVNPDSSDICHDVNSGQLDIEVLEELSNKERCTLSSGKIYFEILRDIKTDSKFIEAFINYYFMATRVSLDEASLKKLLNIEIIEQLDVHLSELSDEEREAVIQKYNSQVFNVIVNMLRQDFGKNALLFEENNITNFEGMSFKDIIIAKTLIKRFENQENVLNPNLDHDIMKTILSREDLSYEQQDLINTPVKIIVISSKNSLPAGSVIETNKNELIEQLSSLAIDTMEKNCSRIGLEITYNNENLDVVNFWYSHGESAKDITIEADEKTRISRTLLKNLINNLDEKGYRVTGNKSLDIER